jgi:hypothetical protein
VSVPFTIQEQPSGFEPICAIENRHCAFQRRDLATLTGFFELREDSVSVGQPE